MHVDAPAPQRGPTQNYEGAPDAVWHPRPALAWTVRAVVVVGPGLLALAVGLAAVRWLPPERLSVDPRAWLAAEIALVAGLLLLVTRWARRLLPLVTLLRLTTVFPDRAPSRLRVAMRHHSPAALLRGGRHVVRPEEDATAHAALLLDLVTSLHRHDRATRAHCERVQAYTALIATEMGLPSTEVARLGWAALLHDIGKLRVPASIITKPTLPTEQEWEILAAHPAAGMEIARPLAEWLGPTVDAIGQHHERWDGKGYPAALAGTDISLAARLVAVADAFDTITSARSYKRALPAAAARAELARCAGAQFDPEVVRAFLRVGLVRLHRIAGPMSLLSAVPGIQALQAPLSFAQSGAGALSVAAAPAVAGATAVALVVSTVPIGSTVLPPPPPTVGSSGSGGTVTGGSGGTGTAHGTDGPDASADLPGSGVQASGGLVDPAETSALPEAWVRVVPVETGTDPAAPGPEALRPGPTARPGAPVPAAPAPPTRSPVGTSGGTAGSPTPAPAGVPAAPAGSSAVPTSTPGPAPAPTAPRSPGGAPATPPAPAGPAGPAAQPTAPTPASDRDTDGDRDTADRDVDRGTGTAKSGG